MGFQEPLSVISQLLLRESITGFYWGDDRVRTTCAGGEQQCRLGGLSLHAQKIWQTPDTSWPLAGWTLDLRCSHRAKFLSALSQSNSYGPTRNACTNFITQANTWTDSGICILLFTRNLLTLSWTRTIHLCEESIMCMSEQPHKQLCLITEVQRF